MQKIQAPHLSLAFYWSQQEEQRSYANLVGYLLNSNVNFAGCVSFIQENGAANHKFGSPQELKVDPGFRIQEEIAPSQLTSLLSSRDYLIVETSWKDLSLLEHGVANVGYVTLADAYKDKGNHPIEIFTSGEYLCGNLMQEHPDMAALTGRWSYETMCSVAQHLEPDFASIYIEDNLPCLEEIIYSVPSSLAFRDFYLSNHLLYRLGSLRNELMNYFSEGYFEDLETGVYFSSFRFLNPKFASVQDRCLSEKVQKLLKRGLASN